MRLKRAVKRTIRSVPFFRPNPFAGPAEMIVHCSHHKAGTVWFGNVLNSVATRYYLPMQRYNRGDLQKIPTTGIFFSSNSRLPANFPSKYRGSHIVRDLRDIVVSGYFYHLWTQEEWAHVPRQEFGGLTYQEYLKRLDRNDGLLAEMERFDRTQAEVLRSWNFSNQKFLEIKYEDMIRDEVAGFQRLFRHYGFSEQAVARCVEIAKKHSFERKAGRRPGEKQAKSHLRSGKPGEWRELFTEEHKARFKELMGPLLIKAGYEQDLSW